MADFAPQVHSRTDEIRALIRSRTIDGLYVDEIIEKILDVIDFIGDKVDEHEDRIKALESYH